MDNTQQCRTKTIKQNADIKTTLKFRERENTFLCSLKAPISAKIPQSIIYNAINPGQI